MEQFSHIEESVKALWEKAKLAGEKIARLREENRVLQAQMDALQQEASRLQKELAIRDQHIRKLEAAQVSSESKSTAVVLNGEREALTAKVKELLARIDAYL